METTQTFEDAIQFWTEALNPATKVEKRMTTSIARQDFLIHTLLERASQDSDELMFAKWMRVHRDLTATLDSLIHAFTTLQKRRLSLERPPPSSPKAKAKAKVIPFPNRPSLEAIGRPQRVQLEAQPVPALEPFTATSRHRRSGERAPVRSIDLKVAA